MTSTITTQNHHARPSIGRRLFEKPTLWQDWDAEAPEGAARYWELFTDLLMVAAASSIADTLKENRTAAGIHEFIVLYFIVTSGWLLYTHHFTTRFEESSLSHTIILFFFLVGMAIQIVNAGLPTAAAFSLGVVLQRSAFSVMLIPVAYCIPRSREMVQFLLLHSSVVIIVMLITVWRSDWALWTWTVVAVWDFFLEEMISSLLPGRKLVPINIEHTMDRLGALVLVMLGETVISATMTYREYAADATMDESRQFYVLLALAFLLIFMFTLLYFNVQPPARDHAFRRTRRAGTLSFVLNKTLGLTLLFVGVSIKLAVHEVAHPGDEENTPIFTVTLLGAAVGCSLVLILGMRLCHYAGVYPRPSDPEEVQRLMWIWWIGLGLFSMVPFGCVNLQLTPVKALGLYSALITFICIAETWLTHVLEDYLPRTEEHERLHREVDDDEISNYMSVMDQGSFNYH